MLFGCFFYFTGMVIANTLRQTVILTVSGSYVFSLVEATRVELVSENSSAQASPGAACDFNSLCPKLTGKPWER